MRIVSARGPYEPAKPIKDAGALFVWRSTKLAVPDDPSLPRPACSCCGILFPNGDPFRQPEVHHLVKFWRSHEPCNLLLLCKTCPMLAEGRRINNNGAQLPRITMVNCLWLRKKTDGFESNRGRLGVLFGRNLPKVSPVHEIVRRTLGDVGND